jgi:hypothetical protein
MQDVISAVSGPSFRLNVISHVITLFIYMINGRIKQSKTHANETKTRADS